MVHISVKHNFVKNSEIYYILYYMAQADAKHYKNGSILYAKERGLKVRHFNDITYALLFYLTAGCL